MSVRASEGLRPKLVGEGGLGIKASKSPTLVAAELELPPLLTVDAGVEPSPRNASSKPVTPPPVATHRQPTPKPPPDLRADTRANIGPDLAELPALAQEPTADLPSRPTPSKPVAPPRAEARRPNERPAASRSPELRTITRAAATPDLSVLPPLADVGVPSSNGGNSGLARVVDPKVVALKPVDEPLPPGGLQRPGTGGAPEIPELKAVTQVGDVASFSSRGSLGSDGVDRDGLPSPGPSNPPPRYPDSELSRRIEGSGKLLVRINTEGRVTSIRIYRSSGVESFDQSALDAHRRWVYTPARRRGKAIPFEFVQPFEFVIRR